MASYGPCLKCDSSLINYKVSMYQYGRDKFCSKCGTQLLSKCSDCKGSGDGGYCTDCGRKLKCSKCDGEGEIYNSLHVCLGGPLGYL